MKRFFVAAILLLTVVIGWVRWLKPSHPASPSLSLPPPSKERTTALQTADSPASWNPSDSPAVSKLTDTDTTNSPAVAHEDAAAPNAEQIEAKIEQLQDYGFDKNNPEALSKILDEVASPGAELRTAALEAVTEYNSRDAIPRLREIEAATEDSRAKLAILDAIEYLELPSFGEIKDTLTNRPSSGSPRLGR